MLNNFFSLKCPDCREKIDENQRYCLHCGADLDAPLDHTASQAKVLFKQYLEKAQVAYDTEGNLSHALSDCEIALQYNPDSADAHNLRGLILDALGKIDDAIHSYKEALRLDPGLADARINLRDAESERYSEGFESTTTQHDLTRPQSTLAPTVVKLAIGLLAVICIMVVGGLLFLFGREYLLPKTVIVFEPDIAQVTTIDPPDLEKTAEILTERSVSIGYPGVHFGVSDTGEIIGQFPGYVDSESIVTQISAIGLLEFVDFGLTPVPEGQVIRTDLEYEYLPQVQGKEWHTIMTNSGIAAASVIKSPSNTYEIAFSLTEQGQKIFTDYTTENVGSYLGIVLDKVVLSAPMVNDPITEGQGTIAGNFTQETAQELSAILQTTALPIPIRLKK